MTRQRLVGPQCTENPLETGHFYWVWDGEGGFFFLEGVFACRMKAGSDPTARSYSPSPVLYQSCLNIVFPLPFLSFQVSKCPRNTITGPWQLLSWLPKGFLSDSAGWLGCNQPASSGGTGSQKHKGPKSTKDNNGTLL